MSRAALTKNGVELVLTTHSSVNVMVTASEAADRMAWARTIHARGPRRDGPFVPVRPAMHRPIPADVEGWFARAAGGTLFIDDIGQLGSLAQARLSSQLETQSRRVSAATVPNGDGRVRVIAGSGRSLRADLALGAFSDALFYRLNVIHIDQIHEHDSGEHSRKTRGVMSQPHACGPDTDLATVAQLMWDHDCGFMPVVDPSGSIVGVVTDRDICIATSTRRLLPEHISAAQVMTAPIRACTTDDSISDVLATMKQFQIRRVPVVDADGRLQGVVSLNDIVLASNERGEPQASAIPLDDGGDPCPPTARDRGGLRAVAADYDEHTISGGMMVIKRDNDEERSARIDRLVKELQTKRKDVDRGQSGGSHVTAPSESSDQEGRPMAATTKQVTPFARRRVEDSASGDSTKPKKR